MNKIRIFLLDDHQIIIDGIRSLLEGDDTFYIAGEATRAQDALAAISACVPDIVISDLSLPGMSGLEFTRRLLAAYPGMRVMILTMSAGEHNVSELLRAGISGYVLKNSGKDELKKALIKIAKGEKYFDAELTEGMLRAKAGLTSFNQLHLTPRELEVLHLITRELANKAIADALNISERTVETHRKNIFRKTNTRSPLGLLKWAQENRVV